MRTLVAVAFASASALSQAGIIGVVDDAEGHRLEFHDVAGVCVGDARYFEYIRADQVKVPGCYVVRAGLAQMVFFDGDIGVVPVSAIQRPKAV